MRDVHCNVITDLNNYDNENYIGVHLKSRLCFLLQNIFRVTVFFNHQSFDLFSKIVLLF